MKSISCQMGFVQSFMIWFFSSFSFLSAISRFIFLCLLFRSAEIFNHISQYVLKRMYSVSIRPIAHHQFRMERKHAKKNAFVQQSNRTYINRIRNLAGAVVYGTVKRTRIVLATAMILLHRKQCSWAFIRFSSLSFRSNENSYERCRTYHIRYMFTILHTVCVWENAWNEIWVRDKWMRLH